MWTFRFFSPSPSKAVQQAHRASSRLEEARWKLQKDMRELSKIQGKVTALLSRVSMIAETLTEDVEECDRRIAYAERALDAMRSELMVETEVTIPTLQKRLKEMEAESEANIAVSHFKRASATPRPMED